MQRKSFLRPVCYFKRTFRCARQQVALCVTRAIEHKIIFLLGSSVMKFTALLTLGITFGIVLVYSMVSFLETTCKFTLRADARMCHWASSLFSATVPCFNFRFYLVLLKYIMLLCVDHKQLKNNIISTLE